MTDLFAWRHPRPEGAAGRCIGAGTDLPVAPRRAKRLARRIQQFARREGLPRMACCSPLRRSAEVGRWLQRWGWRLHIDPALRELDFGRWEGRRWDEIGSAAVDGWIADFATHAPGGGESLAALLARAGAWMPPASARIVIGHGGWMLARQWLASHGAALPARAADWPPAPRYGQRLHLCVTVPVTEGSGRQPGFVSATPTAA